MDGSSIAPRYGTFSNNASFDDLDQLSQTLNQKSVPTAAEVQARNADAAWALKLVNDFASRPGGSSFWSYQRPAVANQLAVRVNDPTLINQAQTWLCKKGQI